MKAVIKKYGAELYRDLLSISVFLVAVFTGGETERIAPFAVILILAICAGLLLLKSTRYLTLPFLLLSLLLIFCYDSFSVFIRYIWLLPILVVSMTSYLVRKRPPLCRGASLFPLIAVSVATLLGGIGMISPEDYFRPASLVFMMGLGPGLILSYWIVKNELKEERDREMLLGDLLRWGLVAAAVVFYYAVPVMVQSRSFYLPKSAVPQWSNNIATMLMIALPASLAAKNKRLYHYSFVFVIFLATVLAGSRGGQLLVGVELLLCLFVAWRQEKDFSKRLWCRTLFLYAVMAAGYIVSVYIYNAVRVGFFEGEDVRLRLLARGFSDFLENPLFGSGLGYRGNADLFSGKEGTINWYHIFVSQVVGGLGIAGILAWSYQLFTRARLAWRARHSHMISLALCYLGLFLMSMVNPGEFCPVPYAFLAVCLFAALENHLEESALSEKK